MNKDVIKINITNPSELSVKWYDSCFLFRITRDLQNVMFLSSKRESIKSDKLGLDAMVTV